MLECRLSGLILCTFHCKTNDQYGWSQQSIAFPIDSSAGMLPLGVGRGQRDCSSQGSFLERLTLALQRCDLNSEVFECVLVDLILH